MSLTIALDVDGALSPLALPDASRPLPGNDLGWEYRRLTAKGVLVSVPPVDLIRSISSLPGVTVAWHTAWQSEAQQLLEPELGIGPWPLFTGPRDHLDTPSAEWWKIRAVRRWLDAHPSPNDHLLWIDDDIQYSQRIDEVPAAWATHEQLTLISPSVWKGLTPADLEHIRTLVRTHAGKDEPEGQHGHH